MQKKLSPAGQRLITHNFRIKENSWIARIASHVLKSKRMAIVIGNAIHLDNVTGNEFLGDEKWLRHELCHIEQYKRYGFAGFVLRYMIETIRNGYYNNRFEKEARAHEIINQPPIQPHQS